MKTIDKIKEKRTVSKEVTTRLKEFNKIKKAILNTLKEKPKSIPQIAEETKLPLDLVTFHLMTLMKYGSIEVDEIDDMDEYFFYKLTKTK